MTATFTNVRLIERNREIVIGRYENGEHATRDSATLRRAGLHVVTRDSGGQIVRCNCECGYCDHHHGCERLPSGTFTTEYVGDICDHCAQVMIGTGGGSYVHLKNNESEA